MPKISRNILKGHFSHNGGPIITLKTGVAIAMISSLGILTLILFAGLLLPKSVLVKFSNNKSNTSLESNGTPAVSDGTQAISQDKTPQQQAAETAAAEQVTGASTAPSTSTTPAKTPTTPATGAAAAAKVAPTLTFAGSPTSVSSGGSATLSWTINSTATAPVTCTATGGSFAGTKATSGSQAVTLTGSTSYTLTCTNAAGTSGTKTVTISVTAPVVSCGAGGTCSASDIAQHATNGNCWMGVTGTGFNKVYVITSSFNSSHVSSAGKNAASSTRTCGKVISIGTLRGYNGDHSSGSSAKIGGSNFDTWLASFYYANYQ